MHTQVLQECELADLIISTSQNTLGRYLATSKEKRDQYKKENPFLRDLKGDKLVYLTQVCKIIPNKIMKQKNQIGNYQLGRVIGTGTFGKVQLATHKTTGEQVAIKIISRRQMKVQKMNDRIKRELKVLTHFDHPHIIKLFEHIQGINEIYLVMELLQGGELYNLIEKKGRLNEPEARLFFQQLVSGVEYCHQHKVVHRDLKPENLLLLDENTLKLADFGLSNLIKEGEYLKTSCGSPNYAAPEIIAGKIYCGCEVDV